MVSPVSARIEMMRGMISIIETESVGLLLAMISQLWKDKDDIQ